MLWFLLLLADFDEFYVKDQVGVGWDAGALRRSSAVSLGSWNKQTALAANFHAWYTVSPTFDYIGQWESNRRTGIVRTLENYSGGGDRAGVVSGHCVSCF